MSSLERLRYHEKFIVSDLNCCPSSDPLAGGCREDHVGVHDGLELHLKEKKR